MLVTISFSGSDRMDNLLKDHRCPTLPALFAGGWGFSRPRLAHFSRPLRELGLTKIVILSEAKDLLFLVTPSEA